MNKILKKALMFVVISSTSLAHENSKFEYKLDYLSNESEENNDIYNEINYMAVGRAGNVVMATDISYKAISINDGKYNHIIGLSFMPEYIGTFFELGIRPYINKNIFKMNYKKENMIDMYLAANSNMLINASLYLKLKADFEMYNHDCIFAIFGNFYLNINQYKDTNIKFNFTVFEPSFTFSNSEEISLFNKTFNYDVTLTYGLSKIYQQETYGGESTLTLISSINNLNVKSNQTLELWKLDSLNYVNLVVSESMFYTSSYDNIYEEEETSNKCLAANIGITGSIATQFEMYINSTLLAGVFAESTIEQYEYNPYFKFNLTLGQIF